MERKHIPFIVVLILIISTMAFYEVTREEEPPPPPPPPPPRPEFQATLVACDYFTAPNCTIFPEWNLAYFEVFKAWRWQIQPPWVTVLIDVQRIDFYPPDDGDACFTIKHLNYEIWMPSEVNGQMVSLVLETGMGNVDQDVEWNVEQYSYCLAQGEKETYHVAHLLNPEFFHDVKHQKWDSFDLTYTVANDMFRTRIVVGD